MSALHIEAIWFGLGAKLASRTGRIPLALRVADKTSEWLRGRGDVEFVAADTNARESSASRSRAPTRGWFFAVAAEHFDQLAHQGLLSALLALAL